VHATGTVVDVVTEEEFKFSFTGRSSNMHDLYGSGTLVFHGRGGGMIVRDVELVLHGQWHFVGGDVRCTRPRQGS